MYSIPYYTYGSTANFIFLGPISNERGTTSSVTCALMNVRTVKQVREQACNRVYVYSSDHGSFSLTAVL